MNKIKAIILDFDGTLGDTTDVIIRTIQATIKELGLPSRTDAECAAMIGLRLTDTPPALFPEENVNINKYASTYRRLFHTFNSDGAVRIYPHVMETLTELKNRGMILTIASSRSHSTLDDYVMKLGFSDLISLVIGAEDVSEGKPSPEAVNMTLQQLDIKAEEALVVGDTSFDIDMGRNAGAKTCGVTYGNGTIESLSNADWLIDDFSRLLELTELA